MAESTIGLYKTELIGRRRSWRTFAEVECETSQWVDWYNHRRLHGALGYQTPAAYEARQEPGPEAVQSVAEEASA